MFGKTSAIGGISAIGATNPIAGKKDEKHKEKVAYAGVPNIGNILNGSAGGKSTQSTQTAFNA